METNQNETMKQLRAEVKLLMVKGLINPVPGLEDLSEETLRELITEYKETKLKTINKTICTSLVNGLTLLCKTTNLMPDETFDAMKDELLGNEGFMTHTTNIVAKVTPCIPYIGIAVGLGILGKYLYDGVKAAKKATSEEKEE